MRGSAFAMLGGGIWDLIQDADNEELAVREACGLPVRKAYGCREGKKH